MKKTTYTIACLSAAMILALSTQCKADNPNNTLSDSYSTTVTITDATNMPEVNVLDYDLMYVEGSKFVFYKIAKREKLEFKIEKSEIFNYTLKSDKHSAFYSVCQDGKLILKTVDFNAKQPMPKVVTEWDLKCEECITQTYDENSSLFISKDNRYLGIQHEFSWDGYGFTKIKIYDTKESKFVDTSDDETCFECEYFMDDSDESNDEGLEIADKFKCDTKGEEDYQLYFFYCPDENTQICLSDKLGFEGGDCYYREISPKKDRVLFTIVTGEGDFEHGPLVVSSLNGKNQVELKATDFGGGGIQSAWLKDGSLIYTTNFDPDNDNFKPAVMMLPAGSYTPVKLLDGNEFTLVR